MITLFEYGKWAATEGKYSLKSFLRNIWQQRFHDKVHEEEANEDQDSHYQPFLKFDDNSIRANNYIGFIQNGEELIEIYPKVFKNSTSVSKKLMLRHIFYWFSYCRKWRFPFTQSSLDNDQIDNFPELIIYLMAKEIYETVSTEPFMQYQSMEERMISPKGTINFNRYITQSLSKGYHHILECDYEPFVYDNKVNRIIKYCSRVLLPQTNQPETQRLIQETLFVLDEVEDVSCTLHDVNSASFNPFFEDYSTIMQFCKTILESQIYSNSSYDLSQWCLLFPMEYIFEDFVAGFLHKHFSNDWKVEYQKSDQYLTDVPKAFNLQHDIFLTNRITGRRIIVDTKYKVREQNFKTDIKRNVAQSDLYQVLAYAVKRGCAEVMLVYPNVNEEVHSSDEFEINSGFQSIPTINLKVVEIPFWSMSNFGRLNQEMATRLDAILHA